MKIRLVQFNPVAGDVRRNAEGIAAAARNAAAAGVDAVVFPEGALGGFPLGDLARRDAFLEAVQAELARLKEMLPPETVVVFGTPLRTQEGKANAAVAYRGGQGPEVICTEHGAGGCGVLKVGQSPWWVCLDSTQARDGSDVVVKLAARPWLRGGKGGIEAEAVADAKKNKVPVLYANLSGGQDDLVFGGDVGAVGADGTVRARGTLFGEGTLDVEIAPDGSVSGPIALEPDELEAVYTALRTGIRDYALKNRFPGALIALSGGIDSALVAALAVDALGPERVMGVTLPSTVTSSETLDDALELARRLGIPCLRIPIAPAVEAVTGMLAPAFASVDWAKPLPGTLVEENLQARVRGVVTMALSNRYGHLVLSTGNKSESSTGYATLYGDMCGGYAPIKDVPKTLVFALARWRNRRGEVIPPSTIERPPSAELRPGQKDTDSLPPYDVLDPILERFMAGRGSVADLVASGVSEDTARRVARLVVRSEYKRRQAAPGVTLSPDAWRMPITDGFGAW